ncbi:hypothetical protein KAFR_0C03520 [Kazachstania africana CBS 2517]|uniref:non-specific serine/threonine protein kinase n=1 Tax=Kazachstania africana (strain ATCC 22294 / BCRC 22015 / CBS 2517 / CECT 1963 / NBRC 1671 / NRRL Y-8276) TaxID=1071382 RepID=H2ASJ4_KAZAF|nr:hypothetical protein KAFR_0C03520 [Kazachstania africana CBS 2517]CCF57344.1 hypothetical protein KAFR_0C03520 [Kazachstania africana CBS 2517]
MDTSSFYTAEDTKEPSISSLSSISYDEYIRIATERNPTILLELTLSGTVKYVSSQWKSIVGNDLTINQQISNEIVDEIDKSIFSDTIQKMCENDDLSYTVTFNVWSLITESILTLQATGVLIKDNNDLPSYTMWILKPYKDIDVIDEIVDLSNDFVNILGFGSKLFIDYLLAISDQKITNEFNLPLPKLELCSICETFVPEWWLETHSQTCIVEHRIESIIQLLHDNLVEQSNLINSFLDNNVSNELIYKDLPISTTKSESFLINILISLSDLCQYAININTSEEEYNETLKNDNTTINNDYSILNLQNENEKFSKIIYLFSPMTKSNIDSVQNWELSYDITDSITSNGLNLLVTDTIDLAKKKVDAVLRLDNAMKYSLRIKNEINNHVINAIQRQIQENINKLNMITFNDNNNNNNIQSPQPKLVQSGLFADSYLKIDAIPNSNNNTNIKTSSKNNSRSVTPTTQLGFNPIDTGDNSILTTQSNNASINIIHSPSNFKNSIGNDSNSHFLTPEQFPNNNANNNNNNNNNNTSSAYLNSPSLMNLPLSPLLLATNQMKTAPPSIKDYDIIKPISKGAYGSVYLAKKKLTGEYFAIKVLKKSDMIAKNQIMNVKSERAIMMIQSDKPYVAKLFATFQNKDNLFLVMEYLPGGDLATLIKMMGTLPNKWVKQYLSEVIIGVDDMHLNGIIHHDLKPDNLLIDSTGHIKLTDFGLSRAGLVKRHFKTINNESSKNQKKNSHTNSFDTPSTHSVSNNNNNSSSGILDESELSLSLFDFSRSNTPPPPSPAITASSTITTNTASGHARVPSLSISTPSYLRTDSLETSSVDSPSSDVALFDTKSSNSKKRHFFGTPDYLAPETILGAGEDVQCDWWSVGCILFELLLGYPPFTSNTTDEVFRKILDGNIQWPHFDSPDEEEEILLKNSAKDLISKLLTIDASKRLGANGSSEIKNHPYFDGVDWDHVYDEQASFVPNIEDPEDTDYFDSRGAVLEDFDEANGFESKNIKETDNNRSHHNSDIPEIHSFHSSESSIVSPLLNANTPRKWSAPTAPANSTNGHPTNPPPPLHRLSISSVLESVNPQDSIATNKSPSTMKSLSLAIPPHMRDRRTSKLNDPQTEFGSFYFRNLSALDKANKDAINRLKNEHKDSIAGHRRTLSVSSSEISSGSGKIKTNKITGSPIVNKSYLKSDTSSVRSYSPGRSTSLDQTIPSRKGSIISSEISTPLKMDFNHIKSPNLSAFNESDSMKFKSPLSPSTPSINRTSRVHSKMSTPVQMSSLNEFSTPEDSNRLQMISKMNSLRRKRSTNTPDGSISYDLDILLCEPIPIHRYSATMDLENLGCTVISAATGDELVTKATSDIKFDLIVTTLRLPNVYATDIIKLVKRANCVNSDTPIVAATNYYQDAVNTKFFDDVVEKPLSREKLRKLVSKYALKKSQEEEHTIVSDVEDLQVTK